MTNEHEFHVPETTSTRLTKKVIGSHRFRVAGYTLDKDIGVGNYLESATFTVGVYDWSIKYYPAGVNNEHKNYLSFFLQLKSNVTKVKAQVDFTMLHHDGSKSTPSITTPILIFTGKGKESCWGYNAFVKTTTFEASDNLKNDCFTIMCTVSVIVKPSHLELTKIEPPVVVPPSNITEQLCQLLETGEGADVTFEIGGKLFKAHKNVLAARSPVFRAQFFGLLKEGGARNIKLENIEADVFQVFLHYMYSDSVTEIKGNSAECEEKNMPIMYQHLLVIADRYGVDRLKLICEIKLSGSIEVKNFATTLTLAEQHNCHQLKTSCFKFASSQKILTAIMETDEFEHLTKSCPFILKELVKNLRNDN